MRIIEADEAESRFNELLIEVEAGNAVLVTRNGAPIALMTPISTSSERAAIIIDEWEHYRDEKNVVLGGGMTIRELIDDGRT